MLLAFIYILSVVLYQGVDAGSTCFCSATGDPHIRNFNGATSNVGAGAFTLIKDNSGKFSVDVAVAQTSATLTQIAEVNVKLAGDVVEDLPGYGQIHRADGIEIRVLNNNNVFIIWDAAKISDIKDDTLCGGTCPDAVADAVEDAAIKTKVTKLEQTYGIQHNKVANLILSQVNSEIQIDELIRRLAQLKRQGARTDKLLAEIEKFVNNLRRRRRRRRDVDEEEEENELEEAEEEIEDETGTLLERIARAAMNKTHKHIVVHTHEGSNKVYLGDHVNASLDEEVQFGDFGFAHTVDSSDDEVLDDTEYSNMDVDKYVIEMNEEEDFQNTEIKDLLTQQDMTNSNIKVMLGDTEVQLAAQGKIQKVVHRILEVLQANYSNIELCMDGNGNSFLGCLKTYLSR